MASRHSNSGPHGGETFGAFHERVTSGLEAELAGRDITRQPDFLAAPT